MTPKPPWWLERAAKRRVELDLAVAQLRAVLALYADVRGALIFGSYARQAVGPESDLDVIVIRETNMPVLERDTDIRGTLDLAVPYDLITLTPSEFDRLVRERPFYAQANAEGIWIDAA